MPTLTNDVKGVVLVFSQKKGIWSNQFFYLIVAGVLLIGYWWMQDENTIKQGNDAANDSGTSVLIPVETDGNPGNVITASTRLILKVYDEQGSLAKEQELLLPKETIGMDFQSAKTLLTTRYQGVTIGKVGTEEIVLHKTASTSQLTPTGQQMPSEGYFLLKAEQGVIRIYRCNEQGEETFLRETNIAYPTLSQADQELFTYGIVKHSEEELNELLQDFES